MPKANDLNQMFGMIDTIDDPIGSHNDFAHGAIAKLRHNSANLRKLRKTLRMGNEKAAKLQRLIRRV